MALPVGDETTRPGAADCGTECEPDPTPSYLEDAVAAANAAEDAARRAVEGRGITPDDYM